MTVRDRRVVTMGLITVLAAWMALRGIPAGYRHWVESSDRLAQQRGLLAETRRALAALPRMEDSTRALTAAVAGLAPRILSGSTSSVALSDLSGRLGTTAGRHHMRVISLTEQPDSAWAGPLHRVRGLAVMEGDFQGLAELLSVLARDSLVTVVERLQVTPAEPLAPDNVPERLQIELRVTAWYLARESAS